ncbi:MAG TPA: 50S ribosomal protein L20 [Chlamydiales bacterium]|nr:50S ribosomal protein L20 [Chlamydiales bacterium]
MTRSTNAVAFRKRRKRLYKRAKGFVGDRKNHLRLTQDAVMSALSFSYEHRKQKKRNFRELWIQRISVAARINGLSYSKLIFGLKKAGILINRKMLSELAIKDMLVFNQIASSAKSALAA